MGEESRGFGQRRLLRLIKAFLFHRTEMSRVDAANVLGTSVQTADRALKVIREMVPGVTAGRRNGILVYHFDPHRIQEPPTLAEALAVSFGAGFSNVLGGTVYRDKLIAVRDRTIERLAETWRAPLRDVRRKIVVLSHGQELLDDQQERLEMVLGAVIKQHVLEGRYERFGGSVEEFSWRPLSVLVAEGQLYVVAMDSGAPHPFRFARIRECRETTSRFDYPPPGEYDPTVTFRDSLGIYIGSRVSEIHVRLTERWKAFVLTHRWHASQTVKYVGGTHPVEIRLAVHEGPDLERWILGFGREAVVIEPRRLRDRIAACLHDAALLYTGTRRLARGPGRGTPQRSRTRDRR